MRDEAADEFRRTFFSGWAVVLAGVLLVMPVIAASIYLLKPDRAPHPAETLTDAVRGLSMFTSYGASSVAPAVLLVMTIAFPCRPGVGALAGRLGAVAAVVALATLVPNTLVGLAYVGPLSLAPAALSAGVLLVALAMWTSLFEAAGRWEHGALIATGLYVVLGHAVPTGAFLFELEPLFRDARSPGAFALTFLTPTGVEQGLRETLFPAPYGSRWEAHREAFPILYAVWSYLTAAILWIAVPALLVRPRAGPPAS